MTGVKDLNELISGMTPELNEGDYVFVSVSDCDKIDRNQTICEFKEKEGTTLVISRDLADEYNLTYDYIAAWITLTIHSSLYAVGLTAVFSTELASHNISCNVIAGYYHDHIFVAQKDAKKAIKVLSELAKSKKKDLADD